MRAACSFATRSRGTNGQSPGTLATHSMSGRFAATQSRPARMPASGPAKSGTLSVTTGNPNEAKRAGSPFALSTRPLTCGVSRASARCKMLSLPTRISALSPPPMRRASPPARTRPNVSVVMHRRLAPVLAALLLDVSEVLVEHDAVLAGERNEAFSPCAADEREPGLACKLHAPGGEARPRHQDRDAHAHGLDHHLGGEPARGVEDLVVRRNAVLEHPAGNFVDRVVAPDVLHVNERAIFLREHAAVDRARFEVERRRGVDLVRQRIEP